MNQTTKILNYMRTKGRITPLIAQSEFSCARLAARIFDLKERGYLIGDRRRRAINGTTYKEYFLKAHVRQEPKVIHSDSAVAA